METFLLPVEGCFGCGETGIFDHDGFCQRSSRLGLVILAILDNPHEDVVFQENPTL